jgi:hypothetical protein
MLEKHPPFKNKYPLEMRIKIKSFLTQNKTIAEIVRNLDYEEKMFYIETEIVPRLVNNMPSTIQIEVNNI